MQAMSCTPQPYATPGCGSSTMVYQNMEDQMATLLEDFVDLAGQFMQAIVEVFPECMHAAAALGVFRLKTRSGPGSPDWQATARDAIVRWHREMAPYYAACQDCQDDVMHANIDLFSKLRIAQKWTPDLHPDTKAATFAYLQRLNDAAGKYAALTSIAGVVPSGLFRHVEAKAAHLIAELESGERTLATLNFQELTRDMVSAMDPAALEAYRTEILSAPGGAMGIVGKLVGNIGYLMRDAPAEAQPLVASMVGMVSGAGGSAGVCGGGGGGGAADSVLSLVRAATMASSSRAADSGGGQ